MMIKLNKRRAIFLLILLFPIVMVIKAIKWISGERKKVYINTVDIDPLIYTGDKPMVVSVWASWAGVWGITEKLVDGLKDAYAGKCEFVYVEGNSPEILKKYKVGMVLPV